MCLAKTDQERTPTAMERAMLTSVGEDSTSHFPRDYLCHDYARA